jgi:hypothetical protein
VSSTSAVRSPQVGSGVGADAAGADAGRADAGRSSAMVSR